VVRRHVRSCHIESHESIQECRRERRFISNACHLIVLPLPNPPPTCDWHVECLNLTRTNQLHSESRAFYVALAFGTVLWGTAMAKNQLSAVGAPARAKQHIFTVQIPDARSVVVTGSFCDWSPDGRPMRHDGNGTWKTSITLPMGRYEYRLLIDGEWRDDPASSERVANGLGGENCVFQV
jgi:hypothetical protein